MRAIIVDDEPLSRTRLRQLLRAEPDVQIVAECATGAEAIEATERLKPDVLFLDVQMPEIDGFGVLSEVSNGKSPLVVFVTAFDEYAVRAFDVLALDYVLKPVSPERLASACERARAALTQRSPEQSDERLLSLLAQLRSDGRIEDNGVKRLFIRTNGSVVVLHAGEVAWIEAAGNYVKIHSTANTYTVRGKLSDMEAMLDGNTFARIHRSTIVNLDHVTELQPWFSGEMLVLMRDGTKLKLSRTYRHEFENRHRIFS